MAQQRDGDECAGYRCGRDSPAKPDGERKAKERGGEQRLAAGAWPPAGELIPAGESSLGKDGGDVVLGAVRADSEAAAGLGVVLAFAQEFEEPLLGGPEDGGDGRAAAATAGSVYEPRPEPMPCPVRYPYPRIEWRVTWVR